MTHLAFLPSRTVIRMAGPDTKSLLQGIVTNDVHRLDANRAIYAALLTPQGKFLFDFLLGQSDEAVLMDADAARRDDLVRRLTMYRLRAQVEITPMGEDWAVAAIFGEEAAKTVDLSGEAGAARAFGDGVAFTDPRDPALGARIVAPKAAIEALAADKELTLADEDAYDRHRLEVGVPDSRQDYQAEKTLALEANLDLLNGVDFYKGCYVGQELTARTHFRGKVRYRLYPVRVDGAMPEPGTAVTKGEKKIGEMRSGREGRGLAFLKSETLEDGDTLTAGEATLTPVIQSAQEAHG